MALAPSAIAPAAPVVVPKGMIPAQPNVIPPSVQAVIERGNQLQADHIARLNGEPVGDPSPDPAPAPTPADQTPPAADATPPPAEPSQPENWEQRFKSLEGRFNSQFPKLREQNEQLASEVHRLVAENRRLQQTPPMPAPPSTSAAPVSAGLTQEEIDSFGPDLVDVIQRAARVEAEKIVNSRLTDVTSRVNQVQENAEAQSLHRMIDFMVGYIPNFVELNSDPELLKWLALPDAMSGVTRKELLSSAWDSRNGPRTLAIFNSYLAESGTAPRPAGSPAAPSATPAPASAPPPSNRVPLINLAAPGRGSSSAPSGGPGTEKPTYTRAQISQFFRDVTMPNGPWRGRQAEKDAAERDIFAAQLEGRVVG